MRRSRYGAARGDGLDRHRLFLRRPSSLNSFFSGAAFCKYVCPIGQFNFVQALVSPLEVKVREPAVCASCGIRNASAAVQWSRLWPRRSSSLASVATSIAHSALIAFSLSTRERGCLEMVPGQALWTDPFRSGIGRFSRRPDLAALVLVLVFGAFANARRDGLGRWVKWEDQLRPVTGQASSAIRDDRVLRPGDCVVAARIVGSAAQ